jgi:selenoprotein W-related protein
MTKLLPELKRRVARYQLEPADGGRFEIFLDGELVYSKLQTGAFPDEREIIALLKKRAA